MTGRSVTIEDVAKAAGVSRQTVSRVLNHASNVSAKARENVERAIADLGYVPNLAARRMGGSRSFTLLALLDPATARSLPLGEMMLAGLACCHEHGYLLVFDQINMPEGDQAAIAQRVRAMIASLRPDGVILLPPLDRLLAIETALKDTGTHNLSLANRPPATGPMALASDESLFAEEATQRLVDLGHRQVGFIAGGSDAVRSGQRLDGYRRALARSGSRAHRHFVAQAPASQEEARALARQWLVPTIRPTAILAETAATALAVHETAARLGVRIPRELSLLCLEDSSELAVAEPPISAFHRPFADLFARACTTLIAKSARQQLADDGEPGAFELTDRASLAKAPRAV